jgi:hypothetical protein
MTDLLLERLAHRALPSGPGKGPGGGLLSLPSGSKRCPVIGCDERIDPSRLMCRRDWFLVPYELRNRIWATWRSGAAALSPEHLRAVHEAIVWSQAARSEARREVNGPRQPTAASRLPLQRQVVDDEQLDPGQAAHLSLEGVVEAGGLEALEQPGGGGHMHGAAAADGGSRQRPAETSNAMPS